MKFDLVKINDSNYINPNAVTHIGVCSNMRWSCNRTTHIGILGKRTDNGILEVDTPVEEVVEMLERHKEESLKKERGDDNNENGEKGNVNVNVNQYKPLHKSSLYRMVDRIHQVVCNANSDDKRMKALEEVRKLCEKALSDTNVRNVDVFGDDGVDALWNAYLMDATSDWNKHENKDFLKWLLVENDKNYRIFFSSSHSSPIRFD